MDVIKCLVFKFFTDADRNTNWMFELMGRDEPIAVNNHWSQVHQVHHEQSGHIVPMTETGFADVGWLNLNPNLAGHTLIRILTLARVSRGFSRVSLFLFRLLTCSTTREKWDMALSPSLACSESSTS